MWCRIWIIITDQLYCLLRLWRWVFFAIIRFVFWLLGNTYIWTVLKPNKVVSDNDAKKFVGRPFSRAWRIVSRLKNPCSIDSNFPVNPGRREKKSNLSLIRAMPFCFLNWWNLLIKDLSVPDIRFPTSWSYLVRLVLFYFTYFNILYESHQRYCSFLDSYLDMVLN